MSNWIRVTKTMKCPICGKPDWCGISSDGKVAHCMRIQSPKPVPNGGWIHRLNGCQPVDFRENPHYSAKNAGLWVKYLTHAPDFSQLNSQYRQAVQLDIPAKRLGVSGEALHRIGIGYDGKNYTFPMVDNDIRIVGIRIRADSGKKWSVKGSKNALFKPAGVHCDDSLLVICEGPTDCAALLTLGFNAIGRPSCLGGVKYIIPFLRAGPRREVVIMADRDEPKRLPNGSLWRPGYDGAMKLARQVKWLTDGVKVVKPPRHKDIRRWLIAGATKDTVQAIINNSRYIT